MLAFSVVMSYYLFIRKCVNLKRGEDMKKFNNVEVSKVETVRLNGGLTNIYEVRKIDGNDRVFDGRFSGKTYKEAYEAYLIAEMES